MAVEQSVVGRHRAATDERTKQLKLRRRGACRECGTTLDIGTKAMWDRSDRTVVCLGCYESADKVQARHRAPEPTVEVQEGSAGDGVAGASARREHERRRAKDEERLRARWGRLGGMAVALADEPQSTSAWAQGAAGEERVGQVLDRLARRGLRVLHDRRVPGSRANIDHLVVTPSAVWVVDAKRYKGRPRRVTPGGRLRPRVERLEVGRRDRTRLVEGVLAQAALVSDVVGDDVPVRAALCFVDADWPLLGSDFVVRDVLVTWPRRLSSVLSDELDGSALDLAAVHQRLNVAFRVA